MAISNKRNTNKEIPYMMPETLREDSTTKIIQSNMK